MEDCHRGPSLLGLGKGHESRSLPTEGVTVEDIAWILTPYL